MWCMDTYHTAISSHVNPKIRKILNLFFRGEGRDMTKGVLARGEKEGYTARYEAGTPRDSDNDS